MLPAMHEEYKAALPTLAAESESAQTVQVDLESLTGVFQNAQLTNWGVKEATFAAPWGIRSVNGPMRFYCLLEGACRVEINAAATTVLLRPGDLALIMQDCDHCLRDGPDSPTIPIEQVCNDSTSHAGLRLFCGAKQAHARLILGYFLFEQHGAGAFMRSLPRIIHISGKNGETAPWLGNTLRILLNESDQTLPGRRPIANRIAQVMFIQAVRSSLATPTQKSETAMAGQVDPDILPVLEAIHARLEFSWTVASMAEVVCMSRSVFAARFKTLMSQSPIRYLLDCRMRKATALLAQDRCSIKHIAHVVGYRTQASFSSAFKRWSGKSPGRCRKGAKESTEANVNRFLDSYIVGERSATAKRPENRAETAVFVDQPGPLPASESIIRRRLQCGEEASAQS
jgi:AraC family transcriptional regulator, alkane utilization regulator